VLPLLRCQQSISFVSLVYGALFYMNVVVNTLLQADVHAHTLNGPVFVRSIVLSMADVFCICNL